jgi:hypothetical protein
MFGEDIFPFSFSFLAQFAIFPLFKVTLCHSAIPVCLSLSLSYFLYDRRCVTSLHTYLRTPFIKYCQLVCMIFLLLTRVQSELHYMYFVLQSFFLWRLFSSTRIDISLHMQVLALGNLNG